MVTLSAFPPSHAYAEESNSYFDLSLEDLLNVKVSVASTKSEEVIKTPAIVSRYNRVDLEKMGVSTLREMFNFIPGAIVQDSLPGFASVQIRGIDETFNQKVLFLLDGVPYHQASHSIVPMEGIPWESISHVEVIRGPGSVFYGTQATAGVFNVITRTDTDESSSSFKVGSNNLYEGSAYHNIEISDDSTLYIAAEYRTEDGYTTTYNEVFPDIGLITDDVDRYLKRQSGLLRYNSEGFTLQLQAFSDTTVGINDFYADENTLQPFIVNSQGKLLNIEKSWSTDNSKTTLFTDYNHYTFEIQINNLFAPNVHALAKKDNNGKGDYRLRVGGLFDYNINSTLNFVMGAEHETRSTDNYRFYFKDTPDSPIATLLENQKIDEISVYSQLDYSYQDWRFLIGGRFTENEKSGHKVTPRAAVVYMIDEYQSIKALYSSGFNSPNHTQTSLNPTDAEATITGSDSLTAEVVNTTDIAYSYTKSNVLFVANIYYLDAEDFILRKRVDNTNVVSFFNDSNFTRRGAELDLQIAFDNSKVFANLAYQKEGNREILEDSSAFNTPRMTFNIGLSTDIGTIHSIGANITYIGERHNLNDYNIVNVNYTLRLPKFDVFAIVRNVFDEDILNPDNTTQTSDLVASGEDGINAQLGIRINF